MPNDGLIESMPDDEERAALAAKNSADDQAFAWEDGRAVEDGPVNRKKKRNCLIFLIAWSVVCGFLAAVYPNATFWRLFGFFTWMAGLIALMRWIKLDAEDHGVTLVRKLNAEMLYNAPWNMPAYFVRTRGWLRGLWLSVFGASFLVILVVLFGVVVATTDQALLALDIDMEPRVVWESRHHSVSVVLPRTWKMEQLIDNRVVCNATFEHQSGDLIYGVLVKKSAQDLQSTDDYIAYVDQHFRSENPQATIIDETNAKWHGHSYRRLRYHTPLTEPEEPWCDVIYVRVHQDSTAVIQMSFPYDKSLVESEKLPPALRRFNKEVQLSLGAIILRSL